MTISDIITAVDALKPNSISAAQKTAWISTVEGHVQREITGVQEIPFAKKYAGTSFASSFVVITKKVLGLNSGDIITVSGCTVVPANNKSATILTVFEMDGNTVLSFAPGTFSTGIEPGLVTFTRSTPQLRTLYAEYNYTEDGSTTALLVPSPYNSVYQYYVEAMLAKYTRDYDDYNVSMAQFNADFNAYAAYYRSHTAQTTTTEITNIW